ncbi:MAG: sulfite exporter TauE/SafE family protein [Cyanobacteria bacterium J06627_28]
MAVGLSLGLIGGGGAILAVPILVYVLGVGTKSAIAISLVSVGTVSLIGTILHWQKGNVRADIALLFAPTAMLGAYLGALFASLPWVSEDAQLLCFSIAMVMASLFMILKSKQPSKTAQMTHAEPSVKKNAPPHWLMIPAEGLGIGMITGFVGIGGGFAIVPALVLLTNMPMKQAIGTSLLIITLKSITGFLGYLGQVQMSWSLVGSFSLAAGLGTLLGSYLNQFMSARILQASFGYFVLSFAFLMLTAQFSF